MDVASPLPIGHQLLKFNKFGICMRSSVDYILYTLVFEILLPHIVVILPELDIKITAITVEYLKAEIVNISKPYLENLVYK